MEKFSKNTMLGVGLLVLAVVIYKYNTKKGVGTVGVNASMSNADGGCASCSNADGKKPFWANDANW